MTALSMQPAFVSIMTALEGLQYRNDEDILINIFAREVKSQIRGESLLRAYVSVCLIPSFFLHPYFETGDIVLQRAEVNDKGKLQMKQPLFATPVQQKWVKDITYLAINGENIMTWLDRQCAGFAPANLQSLNKGISCSSSHTARLPCFQVLSGLSLDFI